MKFPSVGRTELADLEEDWDRFYEEYSPLIHVLANRKRYRAVDPEDAVQEAWLAIIGRIRRRNSGGGQGQLLNWLTILVRNRLANLERDTARRLHTSLHDSDFEVFVDWRDSPVEALERRNIQDLVREALEEARSHLPEASHRILFLRWIEGLTAPEIAESLGITPAQVRDRHRRALPAFRWSLARSLGSDLRSVEMTL